MARATSKKHYKRKRRGLRKSVYIILMIIIVCLYLCGQYFYSWEWLTETVATIIAIIAAVAFWLEYYENKLLNEAQFIMDLNEQFVGDEHMSSIEWELEKYYHAYQNEERLDEISKAMEEKFSIENKERQYLVNYLVHLEGIATLVKTGVLHIEMINDLMAYRYFIALNNPVVQKLELLSYAEFYQGCFGIYDEWVEFFKKQGVTPPMYDKKENCLTRKLNLMERKQA